MDEGLRQRVDPAGKALHSSIAKLMTKGMDAFFLQKNKGIWRNFSAPAAKIFRSARPTYAVVKHLTLYTRQDWTMPWRDKKTYSAEISRSGKNTFRLCGKFSENVFRFINLSILGTGFF